MVLDAACGLCRLLAGKALAVGNFDQRFEWLMFASLLVVGFCALLRPCEIVALRPELIREPSEIADDDGWALVAIEQAKNRRAMGKAQFFAVRDR